MDAAPLVLYTRPGCHLCDEMKAMVEPIAREHGRELRLVDISDDPALEAEYGEEIPVLLIGGRKAFKYRCTERELRRRLARA